MTQLSLPWSFIYSTLCQLLLEVCLLFGLLLWLNGILTTTGWEKGKNVRGDVENGSGLMPKPLSSDVYCISLMPAEMEKYNQNQSRRFEKPQSNSELAEQPASNDLD